MKGFLMREKQQLINTAEGMAIVRAIEASRPEGKRICYDPIARSLVSSIKFTLSKLVIDSGIYGRIFKGAIEFITARERYIDDFLKTCLSESLDQVVILGAGFDTRAYRIQGIEKTRVFEIEPYHPESQAGAAEESYRPLSRSHHLHPCGFQYTDTWRVPARQWLQRAGQNVVHLAGRDHVPNS